jgi:hypothetical protein
VKGHTTAKDKAVEKFRVYHGSLGRVDIKTAQKLYNNAMNAARSLARAGNHDETQVIQVLGARAQSLGPITPIPGKHY